MFTAILVNTSEYLKTKVTVCKNNPGERSFMQVVVSLISVLKQMENKQLALPLYLKHKAPLEQKEEIYKQAKQKMPYVIVSGTFPEGKLHDDDILTTSNVMTIDIDHLKEQDIDIDTLRKKIFDYPYVIGVYKSQSRDGLWALVAIEETSKIKEYYYCLSLAWKSSLGVKIDPACKNIARRRYLSYNPDWKQWTKKPNEPVKPWNRIRKELPKKPKADILKRPVVTSFSPDDSFIVSAVKCALDILPSSLEDYYSWELLAERLKNFEHDFWPDFKECCSKSPRVNRVKTWKRDLNTLEKVFMKNKSHTQQEEAIYFYKILKDEYGKNWTHIVNNNILK